MATGGLRWRGAVSAIALLAFAGIVLQPGAPLRADPLSVNGNTTVNAADLPEGARYDGDFTLTITPSLLTADHPVGATNGVSLDPNGNGGAVLAIDPLDDPFPHMFWPRFTGSVGTASTALSRIEDSDRYTDQPLSNWARQLIFEGGANIGELVVGGRTRADFRGGTVTIGTITGKPAADGTVFNDVIFTDGAVARVTGAIGPDIYAVGVAAGGAGKVGGDLTLGTGFVANSDGTTPRFFANGWGTIRLSQSITYVATFPNSIDIYINDYGTLDVADKVLTINRAPSSTGDVMVLTNYSTLAVTVNGAAAGQVDASTAGGITTDATATVAVTVAAAPTADRRQYVILRSNAPFTLPGTVTDDSVLWDFVLSLSGSDLVLTAIQLHSFAGSPGLPGFAAGAASTLDAVELAGGYGADMGTVLSVLNGLPTTTALNAALAETVPDVSGGTEQGSRQVAGRILDTVQGRLLGLRGAATGQTGLSAGDPLRGTGAWMQGFGGRARQGQRDGVYGYHADLYGIAVGADRAVAPGLRIGLALAHARSGVDSDGAGSGNSTDIAASQLAAYGSWDAGRWYADGMLLGGYNSYRGRRDIAFIGRQADSDRGGWQAGARAAIGHALPLSPVPDAVTLSPEAMLQYTWLRQDGYAETGAGALNLNVAAETATWLTAGLGARLAGEVEWGGLRVAPSASAFWLHDIDAPRGGATASFAGGGAAFVAEGAAPARDALALGLGLGVDAGGGLTIAGRYDGELRSGYSAHGGSVTATWAF